MCKKLICLFLFVSMLGCLCILNAPAFAGIADMTGTNAANNSSFNMNINWSGLGPPSAGNDYYTGGYLMRSPADGATYLPGPFTFLGDKLTIGYSSTGTLANPFNTNGAVNNNSLIFKLSGQTLTVNNLVLDAGNVRDGLGDADNCHLAGNIYVTANGGGFLSQCSNYIDSVISGPGPIYIGDNGSGGAARQVIFTSGLSTYAGNIIMAPGGTGTQNRSRLTFVDNSIMHFVIGASGVNNSISGTGILTLNGDFSFDLTGAGKKRGDSWTIASVTSQTFGDTFTVVGFNDNGGGLWTKSANGVNYQFNENTGILSVFPEAYNPTPTNGTTIPTTSTVLKWYPGAYAAKHDVYLDTDFNDVNNATEGSHLGVTYYSYRQDANSYSAAGLTPGSTYYWRIDEVNGPPDYTIYKGKIWRFSIQPVKAYNPSPSNDSNYIDPNADLSWSAGIKAKQHKVYFGTTHPLPLVSTQTGTTYDPGKMAFDTLYFWRIDEVNDPNTWTGDEWEFRTRFLYVDAEGGDTGNTVNVSTESTTDWWTTVTTSDGLWARRPMGNDPNYTVGTAFPADIFEASGAIPSEYVEDCMPLMTTIYGLVPGDKYDISVVYWSPAGSANWNIQAGFTLDNLLFFDRTGQEGAAAGTPTGKTQADRAEYTGLIGRIQADINGKIKIYIDDKPATSNFDRTWYDGVIIAPAALTASNPSPHNGAINAELDADLTWEPGAKAQSHKVYFDPNIAKVQARNGCDVNGVSTTLPSYSLSSLDLLTTYYWAIDEVNGSNIWKGNTWRFTTRGIGEFESYTATGGTSPGTPPEAETLRRTWIDGLWAAEWNEYPSGLKTPGSSGSFAQLNTDTYDDSTNTANIALDGTKSMKFYYDNDGTITWLPDLYSEDAYYTYTAPKYSEVSAAIDDAARLSSPNPPFDPDAQDSLGVSRDWSGYKLLRIPVYGDPNNTLAAGEKLYVGLRDDDGTEVTIYNPDPNIVKQLFWDDWYIPLADFFAQNANLDLTNIARIYIGVGIRGNTTTSGGRGSFFADSIELLPSICIPGSVAGDFTDDCTVNAADLQRMTELWLGQMPTMPTPLIQLDASSLTPLGRVAKDYNWVNTGSLKGGFKDFNTLTLGENPTVAMVEGKKAMVFDGNDILRGSMLAPASITGGNPFTVIYTVWNMAIDTDEEVFSWAKRGTTARSAAVCYGSNAGWGAVAHWDTPFDMGFDRGVPAAHTWHTIGVTYKGGPNSVETVMVDGVVNATEVKTLNIWPSCPMTVGSAYDGNSYDPNVKITPIRPYSGALAKLEVYNVYVPPGNLAILMSTPIDMKKDNVINFKDIAIFAKNWMLGPVLWP